MIMMMKKTMTMVMMITGEMTMMITEMTRTKETIMMTMEVVTMTVSSCKLLNYISISYILLANLIEHTIVRSFNYFHF